MSFPTSASRSTLDSSSSPANTNTSSPSIHSAASDQRIIDEANANFRHQYIYDGSNLFSRPDSPIFDNFYPSLPPSPPSSHSASNHVLSHHSSADLSYVDQPPSNHPSTPSPPSSYASLEDIPDLPSVPLTVHEYADMTFNTSLFRLVVNRMYGRPTLTHQIMHLDDVLRTIARNEEENEILRQTALTYWEMVDTRDFRDLIAPVVNVYDILGRIHAEEGTERRDLPRDFGHTYHEPEGNRENPVLVDIERSESPLYSFPKPDLTRTFRRERRLFRVPYCQIHEQRGHATFMCPYWSCPMCERLNPRHPPQLCPGIGTDEEDQPRPWNQEVQA